MGIAHLKTKLSGGAANADVALSTGGVKSSVAVLSQSATVTVPISGITVVDAAGNATGTGTFHYLFTGKTLQWTPPSGSIGLPVSVGTSGTYLIRGANTTDGYVIVTTVGASLSSAVNYTSSVTIANQQTLFLPAVSKDIAFAGATEYYCFYLDNTGATTIKSVSAQLQTDTPGLDTLSVGCITIINTQGTADGSATTGHGVTFNAVGIDAVMGDITAGSYWGIWIKRIIPAATIDRVAANTFKIKVTSLT